MTRPEVRNKTWHGSYFFCVCRRFLGFSTIRPVVNILNLNSLLSEGNRVLGSPLVFVARLVKKVSLRMPESHVVESGPTHTCCSGSCCKGSQKRKLMFGVMLSVVVVLLSWAAFNVEGTCCCYAGPLFRRFVAVISVRHWVCSLAINWKTARHLFDVRSNRFIKLFDLCRVLTS